MSNPVETPDIKADAWDYRDEHRKDSWIVVPINQTKTASGDLVMGGGMAKRAVARNPHLPTFWGHALKATPGQTTLLFYAQDNLVGLPTKNDWRDPASVQLIRRGLQALRLFSLETRNAHFLIPRLGCGLGGLSWGKIKPIILAELAGHSFTLLYQ